MSRYAHIEHALTDALRLKRRPIAVAFREDAPSGVAKFTGTQPSGCSFWRLALERDPFYTVPSDHYNCPVGSYTHNIPLPPERMPELNQTLGLMTRIGYLKMEEVPGIPRLERTPGVIIYSTLAETPVDPDVVILSGPPARLMVFHEAATRAGVSAAPVLGRPTCMAVPAALTGVFAASVGCVGNRVYTDVPDDDFYVAVAGHQLAAIVDQLHTISTANQTLNEYHQGRRATLATS